MNKLLWLSNFKQKDVIQFFLILILAVIDDEVYIHC